MDAKRIQRKRIKGWKMPPNTVYVGRPSHWGNVYKLGIIAPSHVGTERFETVEQLIAAHRRLMLLTPGKSLEIKTYLHGKNLACWCPLDKPCHADVLLEIANG